MSAEFIAPFSLINFSNETFEKYKYVQAQQILAVLIKHFGDEKYRFAPILMTHFFAYVSEDSKKKNNFLRII